MIETSGARFWHVHKSLTMKEFDDQMFSWSLGIYTKMILLPRDLNWATEMKKNTF